MSSHASVGATLLLAAMDEELTAFLVDLDDEVEGAPPFARVWSGGLGGVPVIVARIGVGKAMAAMTTQALVDMYRPARIVVAGLAGGIDPRLSIGDTVVARDTLQHDLDATALGFERGQVPYSSYRIFDADPALVRAAETYSPEHGRLWVGRVLSGDSFIAPRRFAKMPYLAGELEGMAVEMETAAVGLVATANNIPFVAIRTISDMANHDAAIDFRSFLPLASRNALRAVGHTLNQLRSAG